MLFCSSCKNAPHCRDKESNPATDTHGDEGLACDLVTDNIEYVDIIGHISNKIQKQIYVNSGEIRCLIF